MGPKGPAGRGGMGAVAAIAGASLLVAAACAGLGSVFGVEPPSFAMASERESTVQVRGPSLEHPRGAATVRLWTRVTNPNSFGFTLSTLQGDLLLEDRDVADLDLPLGLPLRAAADTVIPLEITFGFAELGAIADVARALLTRSAVRYELQGTVGVDAGPLGEPRFGPRSWLRGELDVNR